MSCLAWRVGGDRIQALQKEAELSELDAQERLFKEGIASLAYFFRDK